MFMRLLPRVATAASLLVLAACATPPAPATLADTAARTPELSTLSGLIQHAGLADTLRAQGPYTLFAPSNEAFKAVPAETMAKLAADKELLRSVISFHVLAGRVVAADVKNGNVKSVQGAPLSLSKAGTFVTVEDAVVQSPDLPATNGVVHVIDRVLMPPKK